MGNSSAKEEEQKMSQDAQKITLPELWQQLIAGKDRVIEELVEDVEGDSLISKVLAFIKTNKDVNNFPKILLYGIALKAHGLEIADSIIKTAIVKMAESDMSLHKVHKEIGDEILTLNLQQQDASIFAAKLPQTIVVSQMLHDAVLEVVQELKRIWNSSSPQVAMEIITKLMVLIKDANVSIRVEAAKALGDIGSGVNAQVAQMAISVLDRFVSDQDATVKVWATRALGDIGKSAHQQTEKVITILEKFTIDKSTQVKLEIAKILEEIAKSVPEHSEKVMSVFTKLTLDKSAQVKSKIAKILGEIAQLPGQVVGVITVLKDLAYDKNAYVKIETAKILGEIVKLAPERVVEIVAILKEFASGESGYVKTETAKVLGKIAKLGPEQAVEIVIVLKEIDSGESIYFKAESAKILTEIAKLGPKQSEAVIVVMSKDAEKSDTMSSSNHGFIPQRDQESQINFPYAYHNLLESFKEIKSHLEKDDLDMPKLPLEISLATPEILMQCISKMPDMVEQMNGAPGILVSEQILTLLLCEMFVQDVEVFTRDFQNEIDVHSVGLAHYLDSGD